MSTNLNPAPPTQADAATQAAMNLNDLEPALFDYHTRADVESTIRTAFAPILKRAEAGDTAYNDGAEAMRKDLKTNILFLIRAEMEELGLRPGAVDAFANYIGVGIDNCPLPKP